MHGAQWGSLALMSGIAFSSPRIGIRIYKAERQLEVWGARSDRSPYRLVAAYQIAGLSGRLGPKRKEGDRQAPEGFYFVDRFNPKSRFHLSLGLNYPNSSDRRRGGKERLGTDIFIHGNCVSAGCFAMTDRVIDQIYPMAVNARNHGQQFIPVSIFPCRLEPEKWRTLQREFASQPKLIEFWSSLVPAYRWFEQTHLWPRPHVDHRGNYTWPELPAKVRN